jgi:group I intron endonuclease
MMFEHYKHKTLKCIYLITLNGKKYVGQTHDTYTRFSGHRTPSSGCRYISNAIQAYGWDNAKVEILLVDLSIEEANRLETHYIDTLGTLAPDGYNLKKGGDSHEWSEESKKTLSIALKFAWEDPQRKEAQSLRTKETWEDLTFRNKMMGLWENPVRRETQAKTMKEFWEDPDRRTAQSEMMKKMWEDPEFIYKRKELWETSEMREAHARGQQTRYSCQENREKHREAMSHLRRFTDEEFIRANADFNGSVKKMMGMFNVGKTAVNEHKHRLGLIKHYHRKVVA